MNYFGHAALAVLEMDHPPFVLGAMVPDLLAMVGGDLGHRRPPADPSEVERGVQFHLKTDKLFHETRSFLDLNRRALLAFREGGLPRGPSRAVAHLGVEMLFDSELITDERHAAGYLASLDYGASSRALPSLFGDAGESARLLCAHLLERGIDVHLKDPERYSFRILRTLERRPRLCPSEEGAKQMSEILLAFDDLREKTRALLTELEPLLSSAPTVPLVLP